MEYVAMFIWLTICIVLGGLMHAILRTAFTRKWVAILAAPGVTVRKFAMTIAALVSGATVTEVNVYRTCERDIGFSASGAGAIAKLLVPLAPLFACALVLQALNTALDSPLRIALAPPLINSADVGGAMGFLLALWELMLHLVRQASHADWGSLNVYVLLAFVFSLSLGAGLPFNRFREAVLGVALLVVGLALVCTLVGVRGGDTSAEQPAAAWALSMRTFLMGTAGMTLIMMLCGMLTAVIVGLLVRLFEMVGLAAGGKKAAGNASGRRGRAEAA